jgi:uncharacterized protein (DUF362 family)
MSTVSIARHQSVDVSIPEALELLGDLSDLFTGKHVAIKPNETWASERDLSACTQADTVRTMIRFAKRFDPRIITVSGGSGDGETDQIFRLLGIDRVIREEGVEFFDHNRKPFARVELDYDLQPEVMVNQGVLEYDTVISLAQHKVHYAATVTLTMKNIAMSYPAADYYGHPRSARIHAHRFYDDMERFIAAMCQRFPFHLGVIVGHPAMIGKGPIGGRTFESELCLASRDFVAVDSVGAELLGKGGCLQLREAQDRGLGTADLDRIEIRGIPLNEARTVFAEHAGERVTA